MRARQCCHLWTKLCITKQVLESALKTQLSKVGDSSGGFQNSGSSSYEDWAVAWQNQQRRAGRRLLYQQSRMYTVQFTAPTN